MRKLFPVAVIALVAVMFTSCKKDYTCSCTYTDPSTNTVIIAPNITIHDTKSHAQSACSALNVNYTGFVNASCSLK